MCTASGSGRWCTGRSRTGLPQLFSFPSYPPLVTVANGMPVLEEREFPAFRALFCRERLLAQGSFSSVRWTIREPGGERLSVDAEDPRGLGAISTDRSDHRRDVLRFHLRQ